MCALLGLMTHAFGYGLFYASVGVLLLPQEALHMFADQHAIFLAVMLALAGMSQLISPLAGYYSDRTCSRMGRRVPYILVGNLVLFLCMGAMWLYLAWIRQRLPPLATKLPACYYGRCHVFTLLLWCVPVSRATVDTVNLTAARWSYRWWPPCGTRLRGPVVTRPCTCWSS